MKWFFSIINWKLLKSFNENKFVRTSYIYLLLVPILVNALNGINNTLNIVAFEESFVIHASLPFRWKYFFFAALFFTLGSLMYYFFAPLMIKQNKHFADFKSKDYGFNELHGYLENLNMGNSFLKKNGFPLELMQKDLTGIKHKPIVYDLKVKLLKSDKIRLVKKIELIEVFEKNLWNGENLIGSFFDLYQFANTAFKQFLIPAVFFYVLGFIMLTTVITEGIITVIRYLYL